MSDYGVKPEGFARKPLAVTLNELQLQMISQFGPGVIQTPQSPLGQLNGLMADIITQLWEIAEDVYQSYDPDQAEGTRLDILARLRLMPRGSRTDPVYRRAITNEGQARIDIQDLTQALQGLDGVSFVRVYTNETGEVTDYDLERGTVAVAIIGGDDSEIARTMRQYIVPGINTYGNYRVSSLIDGYCREMSVIRPIEVPVNLTVVTEGRRDDFGCPTPPRAAVEAYVREQWALRRANGLNVSHYIIRQIIESRFSNIEVLTIQGERDGIVSGINQDVNIGFIEIASLDELEVFIQ